MDDFVEILKVAGVLAALTGTPLLMYLCYALIQRFVVRGGAPRGLGPDDHAELRQLRERVARLEQSVDVVAVEVERVGEAQRFTARLLGERAAAGAPPRP